MSEAVTPQRFHEVDWRVVRNDASTHFRTGSFAEGLAAGVDVRTLAGRLGTPERVDDLEHVRALRKVGGRGCRREDGWRIHGGGAPAIGGYGPALSGTC